MGESSKTTPYRMDDYERAVAGHRLETPPTFNFGAEVVDAWARDPSKLALIWCDAHGNERRLTFDDVARASNRVANRLAVRGVKKGDRVIVMLPRVPEWQIALTACLKVGAIPIPCITMLTERDVAYRVRHSGATAAIATSAETGKFDDSAAFKARIALGSPRAGWDPWQSTDAESEVFAAAEVAAGDTMWCTADTGWSKAGTSIYFGPWSLGSTVLFHDGPFDARRRFELLERYRVTVFCAAATELRRLVLEDPSGLDLSALRLAVSAGESVNPEIIDAWRRLTGVEVLDGYGQTETLMTVLNYPGMPVKPGSMGRPLPGVDAAVLDRNDRLHTRNARGRLVIRAPNPQLMLGYWKDPERSAAQFVEADGERWFVTGDTVDADADGYLFYFGRDDDVIGSSGYRIGPQEVENALIEHPAVQESAVVGLPDPDRGQVVSAFVILAPGFEAGGALAAELQEHVKRITAPYKYPRRVEFVDALPKTVSGKIQRGVLRRLHSRAP